MSNSPGICCGGVSNLQLFNYRSDGGFNVSIKLGMNIKRGRKHGLSPIQGETLEKVWSHKYFLLKSLQDLEMYDLEDFAYNSVNITSFRLIEHSDQNLKAIEDMQRFNAKSYSKVLQVSE